jgi:hypothetical protein
MKKVKIISTSISTVGKFSGCRSMFCAEMTYGISEVQKGSMDQLLWQEI